MGYEDYNETAQMPQTDLGYAGSAKMASAGRIGVNTLKDSQTPIGLMITKVHELQQQVVGISYRLRDHADKLVGEVPENDRTSGQGRIGGGGLVGELAMAIDQLGLGVVELERQASRNTNLA